MNISVLITSFNRRPLFHRTWLSIKEYLPEGSELVVVEEGRDTGWDEYLQTLGIEYQYIFTDNRRYRSCSKAKNIGLKRAKNEIILINDPEVVHLTKIIPYFSDKLSQEPRQFAVPATLHEEPKAGASQKFWYKREMSQAPFVAMVYKKELMDIGGWDERFQYWGNDDNDLMWRLGLNGCIHKVYPEMEILHQWHERPPAYAHGDYNEPLLYEENKSVVANVGKEWGQL